MNLNIAITKFPEAPKTAPTEFSKISFASTERAKFLFVSTLTSEWKHSLYKCEDCNLYYLVRRPQERYKHGMYCRLHLQRRGSARAKKGERQHTSAVDAEDLIEKAAKWLIGRGARTSEWRANSTRKENLADHLKQNISNPKEWLESNAEEIDRRRVQIAESAWSHSAGRNSEGGR